MTNHRAKESRALLACTAFAASLHASMTEAASESANPVTFNWQIFSHLEGVLNDQHREKQNELVLGETALFVNGTLGNRLSFLYEGTYQASRYRDDTFKNERWQLRYQLLSGHYLAAGKIHTPVNHWNDTYHHGRLFFPTISRPLSMDKLVPLHDNAIRLGARNLGAYGFFYDLTVGSGHEYENEVFPEGAQSFTASAGFEPYHGLTMRIGLHRNEAHKVGHVAHGSMPAMPAHDSMMPSHQHGTLHSMNMDMGMATGSDDLATLNLVAASLLLKSGKFEALTEAVWSRGSDNTENNAAFYQYLGFNFSETVTPYALVDWISLDRGPGFKEGVELRGGLGVKFILGDTLDLKVELVRHRDGTVEESPSGVELRAQFSVGF